MYVCVIPCMWTPPLPLTYCDVEADIRQMRDEVRHFF